MEWLQSKVKFKQRIKIMITIVHRLRVVCLLLRQLHAYIALYYIYITAYTATRSESHGSWFIRVLVATFCIHSNHKDLESLFKIVSYNFYIVFWSNLRKVFCLILLRHCKGMYLFTFFYVVSVQMSLP